MRNDLVAKSLKTKSKPLQNISQNIKKSSNHYVSIVWYHSGAISENHVSNKISQTEQLQLIPSGWSTGRLAGS